LVEHLAKTLFFVYLSTSLSRSCAESGSAPTEATSCSTTTHQSHAAFNG
jgi:hypothetical protein